MNVKLLRKVQRAILKHPDQFEMEWLFQPVLNLPNKRVPAGRCGTAACIAGWTMFIERRTHKTLAAFNKSTFMDACDAAEVLDLGTTSDDGGRRLFYAQNWPQPFKSRYYTANTPLRRAKVAAARIDHFIATKGAE